ncbi:hypothetical protein F5879DRAFT_926338 [Lentinula edodes]|nr:hypothetical protein F5879DRAFT_926338 [Lentinula edodes]
MTCLNGHDLEFRGSVNLVGCILEVIEVVSRRREREMVGPQVEEFLPHGISVFFSIYTVPTLSTSPSPSYGYSGYNGEWNETFDSRIVNYASYAKTTVLAYEIFVNLGREVDLVWSANFRWSNVIYYMNRYPVVVFQVWELCYKTSTPQYVHFISISYCDALYQFFWYTSFIPTRAAITASFALRVYAIMDGRLFFVVILTALGVAIVGLDVLQPTLSWYLIPVCWIQWQGVQSSCSQSSDKLSTIATFISLACFDVLTTSVLYFGAVTVPQLIAIALYFQGSSTILNNFMLVLFRDFMSDNGDDLCSYKDKTLVSEQPNESKHCSAEASEGKEV